MLVHVEKLARLNIASVVVVDQRLHLTNEVQVTLHYNVYTVCCRGERVYIIPSRSTVLA